MPNTNLAAIAMPETNDNIIETATPTLVEVPKKTKSNFAGVILPEALQHTLLAMGYNTATPIQLQAIPVAMEGKDILGTAQTGTGKTAAFGIPLIAKILSNPDSGALVILPTRELAMQVMDILSQMLGRQSKVKRALLIGGASMGMQLKDLKGGARIIVGTPGRINDHLKRRTLNLSKTDFLVLDETDRMLDMGFSVQIDSITALLPEKRQTLMFSATMPDNIVKLANRNLINPVRITVGSTTTAAVKIKQDVIYAKTDEKYNILMEELNKRQGSVIIFVKTKRNTDKLGIKLKKDGQSVDVIHGDLRQGQRKRVIDAFRDMKIRILVATDVASRGLDIPHIEHVINYDLPQVPEDYIHRIGRTGRNGQEGSALCLISPDDKRLWRAIERMMDPNAKHDSSGDEEGGKRDYKSNKKRFKPGFKKPGGSGFGDRKPREGGSFGEKKSWGDKPRGERKEGGFERKSWGDKPRGDRPAHAATGEKKHWEKKGFGDSRRAESPAGEKKHWEKRDGGSSTGERKPWGEKKQWDNNRGNSSAEGKPADGNSAGGERKPWGDKPRGDRKPWGDKGGKKFGEKKPWEKKPWDKNRGGNTSGERKPADGNATGGEKKHWEKRDRDGSATSGEKRHWDKKPAAAGGERKHWEKRDRDGSSAPKKKFDKPFGTPKFNGVKKRDMNFESNTGGR